MKTYSFFAAIQKKWGCRTTYLVRQPQIVLEEVFHMLKRMGKTIVCEGVETEEIAEFLKAEGYDEIQGFLYYRPMCQEDFQKLLHMPAA